MKVRIKAFRKTVKGAACLVLLLLVLLILSACGHQPEDSAELTSAAAAQAETALSSAEAPVDAEPSWEKCTVRVINYLFGTEFTVLHPDGSYGIYGTNAICSLSAFNEGVCPVEEIRSGALSAEELEQLQTLLSSLYREGQMLPIEENWEAFEIEANYIYVSVDDSEEAFFLKGSIDWDGYPQKEYKELIRLVHSLYPESVVLYG